MVSALGSSSRYQKEPCHDRALRVSPCCGPPTICVPTQPGPGPCLTGICPSDRVGISGHPPDALQARIASGAPVVGLSVFTPDPRIPAPGAGGLVPSTFSCVSVLDRGCASVTPLCGSDDAGYEADPLGGG